MRLKNFLRLMAADHKDYALYERTYERGLMEPCGLYPVRNFGINSTGQLVLEIDVTELDTPMHLSHLQKFIPHLTPEMKMFLGRNFTFHNEHHAEINGIEFGEEDGHPALYLLNNDSAWNKLQNKFQIANEKKKEDKL